MSEITKLYENAGVETNKYKLCCTGCKHIVKLEVINGYPSKWICDKYDEVANCDKAEPDYSPFTAEKQLALLKLLIRHSKTELYCRYANDKYKLIMYTEDCCTSDIDSFENALASVVCDVWGLLTPEEKQQVKGILE